MQSVMHSHPGVNVQIDTLHSTAAARCSRSEQNHREAEHYGEVDRILSDSGKCDEGTKIRFQRQTRIDEVCPPVSCHIRRQRKMFVVSLITNSREKVRLLTPAPACSCTEQLAMTS